MNLILKEEKIKTRGASNDHKRDYGLLQSGNKISKTKQKVDSIAKQKIHIQALT